MQFVDQFGTICGSGPHPMSPKSPKKNKNDLRRAKKAKKWEVVDVRMVHSGIWSYEYFTLHNKGAIKHFSTKTYWPL